jgi:hypothetical protein
MTDHRREVRFGKEAFANEAKLSFGSDSHKASEIILPMNESQSAGLSQHFALDGTRALQASVARVSAAIPGTLQP